jgi:hypothetical protein
MHGGARARAGGPPQIRGTTSGPSLSIPGVAGSLGNVHPLFHGSNNDDQVSAISDPSSGVQSDVMEDIIGSEHSPAATCEFCLLYNK